MKPSPRDWSYTDRVHQTPCFNSEQKKAHLPGARQRRAQGHPVFTCEQYAAKVPVSNFRINTLKPCVQSSESPAGRWNRGRKWVRGALCAHACVCVRVWLCRWLQAPYSDCTRSKACGVGALQCGSGALPSHGTRVGAPLVSLPAVAWTGSCLLLMTAALPAQGAHCLFSLPGRLELRCPEQGSSPLCPGAAATSTR